MEGWRGLWPGVRPAFDYMSENRLWFNFKVKPNYRGACRNGLMACCLVDIAENIFLGIKAIFGNNIGGNSFTQ